MDITMKENLIIPQVVADMVDGALGQKMSLLPLTQVDNSLQGKPGDTLQFPAFRYIGKAEQVDENGQVQAGVLSADTVSATVKKYAKAVRITDEARLSGFGDPVGEAARQLAQAIDHAVDDALYETLRQGGYDRKARVESLSSEAIAEALTLFQDEQGGEKVLLTDARGFASLRLDPNYLRQGDLAQKQVYSGEAGSIWGCRIVLSSKLGTDPVTKEKHCYILKPGALRLVNKTGTQVEVAREAEYMRDTLYCSKHCAAYLYDAGKLITLTRYEGLETLGALSGIQCLPGGPDAVEVHIPDGMRAPQGMVWAYVLSESAEPEGVFGAALSTAKDWPGEGQDIPTAGESYLHLYLLGREDRKPVKALSLAALAG